MGWVYGMEYIVRVDRRGRIVIPSSVRRELGIGRFVRLYVHDYKIVIEPINDPLKQLSKMIVKTSVKASVEPDKLSIRAYEQLIKEARG